MKRKLADIDTNLGSEAANEGRPVTNKVQIQHPHTTKSQQPQQIMVNSP